MNQQGPGPYERRVIYAKARGLLIELNGGEEPTTIWHWRRLYRRFNINMHVLPPKRLASPVMFYDTEALAGDVFLPRTHDRRQLHQWLVHELIELLMSQDVCSAFVYPQFWRDHHAMAKLIDEIHAQRRLFL